MRRDYIKWYSPSLAPRYGAAGLRRSRLSRVVFPTSGGRFWEYEDRGMVGALAPKIERGELQVICVDSVDQESWYNAGHASGRPAPSPERLRRLSRARGRALRPQPHQLAADGHHRLQLRRIPCHQFRAAPSRYRHLCRQHVRRVRHPQALPRRLSTTRTPTCTRRSTICRVSTTLVPGALPPQLLSYWRWAITIRCSIRT